MGRQSLKIRAGSVLGGIATLVTTAAVWLVPPVWADGPPDAGRAFVPHPQSEDDFGVTPPPSQPLNAVTGPVGTAAGESGIGPDPDPLGQIHDVIAKEGAHIYTETYLPDQWDRQPLPTILFYSPYVSTVDWGSAATGFQFKLADYDAELARYWAARGYAATIAHARGTGKSDGCIDYLGSLERDDISRVVEYLGKDAPWSSGRVGMFGLSYPGATQIAAAGLGSTEHPERMQFLKAIVPMNPPTSAYAYGNSDGVPYPVVGFPASTAAMTPYGTPDSGRVTPPYVDLAQPTDAQGNPTDRVGCQATQHAAGTALSALTGDFTPWFAERELRRGAGDIRVPTLMTGGLFDVTVQPNHMVGFFNRIPSETPHKIVLLAGDHGPPDLDFGRPSGWERDQQDWRDTVTAWYDRWLKGLPTRVENWPAAQVQEATTGQWHSEDSWPPVSAPKGRLALGSAPAAGHDGARLLGDTQPSGSTTYSEDSVHPEPDNAEHQGVGDAKIWWTEPLKEPLHLTGEPRLDLWATLDRPDAHLVANLQAFDAEGRALLRPGGADSANAVLVADGRRSAQHLDPLVDERFEQSAGRPLEHPEEPHLFPIRFWPLDVVVPTGGSLRLSLAGVSRATNNTSLPSESGANITVLQDCVHTSMLRFTTPSPGSKLLNVREPDEEGPLASNPPYPTPRDDGGGIGKRPICE